MGVVFWDTAGGMNQTARPHPQPVKERLAGQPVGRRLKITGYQLAPDLEQRLLELGLTLGTECVVVRYAPLGDPMEVKVRGYGLSLRATEAAGIEVEAVH